MNHIKMALWVALVVLMLFAAETSGAANDMTLDTVLDKWTEALGGKETIESIDLIHATADVTIFGLKGTLHDWAAADGRHHVDLDLAGMFKIVIVSNNGAGWIRDQNGKISELAGEELQMEASGAYTSTMSHLIDGRLPGEVSYEGTEDVTGYHIVRLAPEGGAVMTYYLHHETFLPVRSEQPQQDRTMTATFSDWKEFDGLMMATTVVNSTGDTAHDQLFETTKVEMNGAVTAGIFEKPVDKAQDYAFTSGKSATNIPIELNPVHIFMQASVNGSEPLWFIFDTGASVTVLNTATAEALGLDLAGKIEARGAGEGSAEANLIQDVSFEIPGVKLMDQTAVALPLAPLEPIIGREIDGIFGYDMISRFVVEIDYEKQLMHLYDRESYKYTGNGKRVPIHIDGSTPYANATITMMDGKTVEGQFLIDTGAGSAIGFTGPYTEKNELLASLPTKISAPGGFGVGGELKSYQGRIKSVDLGGLRFFDPVAGFSRDKAGAGANKQTAGIIGGELLSRCTVVFDYDRGEMILEPNGNFEDAYNSGMSGLWVETGGRGNWGTYSVRKVLADSPAQAAGIEAGDIIQTVDGRPVADYALPDLYEYFKREGETVRVTISRNGKTMEKKLRLKKAI